MAIEYTLLLKDKTLSVEALIRKIESLGYLCNKIEHLNKGICVNLNEEIGFLVLLFDSPEYPYNFWETNFLSHDFIFQKVLEFRLDKECSEFQKRYNIMLKIIFDLIGEINKDAILVRNGDAELCFFRENSPILLNNESGIWNMECFRDIIADREICYV